MPGAAVFGIIYLAALHRIGGFKQSEKRQIIKIVKDGRKKLENFT